MRKLSTNVITDNLGIDVPPPLVHLASFFRVNEFHSFTWPVFLERYEEMHVLRVNLAQISQTGLPILSKEEDTPSSLSLKRTQFDEFPLCLI